MVLDQRGQATRTIALSTSKLDVAAILAHDPLEKRSASPCNAVKSCSGPPSVDGGLAVRAIANRRDACELQQLNALLYFTAAIRAHRAVKLSHPFCLSHSLLNCYPFIDKPIIDSCAEWPRAYRQQ